MPTKISLNDCKKSIDVYCNANKLIHSSTRKNLKAAVKNVMNGKTTVSSCGNSRLLMHLRLALSEEQLEFLRVKKRYTEEDKKKAVELYNSGGLSYVSVGYIIGCSSFAIQNWVKKANERR